MNLMTLENISKSYSEKILLKDISLGINEGEKIGIIGVNGTGKSTVLRSINLLYANIINQIVNRKELKQSYAIQLEDIRYGARETQISAVFDIKGECIEYGRRMVRNTGKKYENKEGIRRISEIFHNEYVSDETSLL